jgi:hypothetical protein
MITYPSLGLPEAWRPLFKAMADLGWELVAARGVQATWNCREVLVFEQAGGAQCHLSIFEEAEWCGNNYQLGAMTVIGLAIEFPQTWEAAEAYSLPLTGDWEAEVDHFLLQFFQENRQKFASKALADNAEHT